MAVTELALIRLRDNYDDLELLEVVMQCLELQDDWMRQHQPHTLEKAPTENLSTMYIQKEPPYLLITAPWESPEAHREWIKSKENQTGFGMLSTFIAPGCSSVLLFHLDTAVQPAELQGEFLSRENFYVHRLVHKHDKREAIAREYERLEKHMHTNNPQQLLWGGWRIEKRSDDEDELVVFRCKHVPDEHMHGLLTMADEAETYNFKHIIL